MKRIDLSENSFLGALVIVVGGVGSAIGVAAIFIKDTTVLVAIAAGAGWALCLALFVMNARERRRIRQLESELGAQKRTSTKEVQFLRADLEITRKQAGDWSAAASNVSEASLTALRMVPAPPNPPPRQAPPPNPGQPNEPEPHQ